MKRTLLYGLAGGLGLVLLQYIEYQHLVRAYPAHVYGGLVAVIFTVVGIYLGLKLTRHVPDAPPFALNAEKLKELRITPREHEILGLIAEGLSNRRAAVRVGEHRQDPLLPPFREAGRQPARPGHSEGEGTGVDPLNHPFVDPEITRK